MFSLARITKNTSRNFRQLQSLNFVQRQSYATVKYSKDHEWVRFESGKQAVVGISEEAQSKLGEIVHVALSVKVGDVIQASSVIGEVESVKSVSEVYSPVSGKITAVNAVLNDNPGVVNESAEADGWMIKLEFEQEAEELMSKDAYQKYCEEQEH
ncbi:glycine cleavage H-protein [Naegleria gruberi]|uniref:Glycine cleavage system H protein n=1 Tax=Naegleria gruberi TaxID=5762 RepID=D2VK91_NAEGR|nr:glycine cleavage H-protein [Naegleria gruberi]EFC42909.1 glycine cleavage H-protein [Naegleria gruberi]|eukprot:XP_002675653.1 glycine cleavage H-protein [Naegleria gruberi strain NEG-M]